MTDITQRDLDALRATLGRLDRTLVDFRKDMEAIYARKDVVDPRMADLRQDVEEVKGWITWAQRLVLAAVMLAMLGAVLVQKGGSP